MSAALNQVTLIGNLGARPELRRIEPSGASVCNFNVATNESYTTKDNQKQERTEWHRVVVWGKVAESCARYLDKGRQVCITGRLQTREWTDQEGTKRWSTEVVAQQVLFLGAAPEGQRGRRDEPPPPSSEERF